MVIRRNDLLNVTCKLVLWMRGSGLTWEQGGWKCGVARRNEAVYGV